MDGLVLLLILLERAATVNNRSVSSMTDVNHDRYHLCSVHRTCFLLDALSVSRNCGFVTCNDELLSSVQSVAFNI